MPVSDRVGPVRGSGLDPTRGLWTAAGENVSLPSQLPAPRPAPAPVVEAPCTAATAHTITRKGVRAPSTSGAPRWSHCHAAPCHPSSAAAPAQGGGR